MLGRLIKAVEENSSVEDMYLYAAGVSATTFLTTCVLHHLAFMQGWRVGQVMMTATLGVVYRKAIKIRLQEMSKITSGFIVNLVTNDSERFQQASIFIHFLLLSPIQLAVVTWLIWRQLGWPALFGAIIMVVCTPLYVWFGVVLKRLRQRASGETVRRCCAVHTDVVVTYHVGDMHCLKGHFAAHFHCTTFTLAWSVTYVTLIACVVRKY